MPLLGFGTWQAHGREAYEAVRYALEVGYRHIDTATMYRNEAQVGEAVRDSGIPREEVFVTTKLPAERTGEERRTLKESLRLLGMDYVDLWLVHWPPHGRARPETWREFLALRNEGLARAVGVSNYSARQIDELVSATGEAPTVNQIPWGPSLYDPNTLEEHAKRDVVVEGYSPFKNTNLRTPVLVEVARAHGVSPAQVVLRWHLQHGIVVIPKSVTQQRIRENLDVLGFELSPDEMSRIDGVGR
jgi:2,5-diketo-D-gluconate reductase A